jgi:hypothetical protein
MTPLCQPQSPSDARLGLSRLSRSGDSVPTSAKPAPSRACRFTFGERPVPWLSPRPAQWRGEASQLHHGTAAKRGFAPATASDGAPRLNCAFLASGQKRPVAIRDKNKRSNCDEWLAVSLA